MPRTGERIEHKGVIFEVVEVLPYKIPTPSGTFHEYYLIGYRIIDGNFRSPVAHFYMRRDEDFMEKVQKIIDEYLRNKEVIQRMVR